MKCFSERYGYTNVSDVIIREQMTDAIQNGIWNCWYKIKRDNTYSMYKIYQIVWENFFNRRTDEYENFSDWLDMCMNTTNKTDAISDFLSSDERWYRKLDLLEFIAYAMSNMFDMETLDEELTIEMETLDGKLTIDMETLAKELTNSLNSIFEFHNFAYRIVDGRIVEITSKEEIDSIQEALGNDICGVRKHISSALELMSSAKQTPDYRNSIKESISAVEACCRDISGGNTLNDALNNLEKSGIAINSRLVEGFKKIYAYTNDKDGIRHAFTDNTVTPPSSDEAIFMLVSCSAFINYLTKKNDKILK